MNDSPAQHSRKKAMFKTIFRLLTLCAASHVASAAMATPITFANSEEFTLASKAGPAYKIFVAWPSVAAPDKGFPVIYVLDANAMIGAAIDAARAYATRPDSSAAPSIIIGIGYPNGVAIPAARTLALTPPIAGSGKALEGTGGADRFLDFIQNELKPKIESRWKIDTGRQTLFGHSYGGLFALHVLFTRSSAFQTYVAASPSIWWADRYILREEKAFESARTGASPPIRAMLLAGEYEEQVSSHAAATPAGQALDVKLKERGQVSNARDMAGRLGGTPGVYAQFDEIEAEDHGSVVPVALGRAVKFALSPMPPQTVLPVPDPWEYARLTPEQRYDLRLRVRRLPEEQRRAFLIQLKSTVESLPPWLGLALHNERNEMDKKMGTKPADSLK